MQPAEDFFDPNNWVQDAYEYRIYAPDKNSHADMEKYALVDAEDYWLFSKYAWCIKSCRAKKEYFRRAVAIWENKVKIKTISIYLHVEIMKRVSPPPTPLHVKVDHRNGREHDCRRANLRWATNVMNNRNRHGSHPHDLVDG
jgi:hypothetical protein